MKNHQLRAMTLLLFIITPFFSKAQTDPSFETYARRCDSIFISLYEKRDTQAYGTLLKDWAQQFRQLDSTAQKQYAQQKANAHYNFACTYALTGARAEALEQLSLAIDAGFTDYGHLLDDQDLAGIRNEAAFKALTEPLRALGDYLLILRRGAHYNPEDTRPFPAFTYQPAEKSELKAFRQKYRLDSIAGTGNDISQALNLLHWVHERIPHDGEHNNPAMRNASAMIEACSAGRRGLNCRGLATVLNECYLALGFSSRLVTCLPKDSLRNDPDCHVINVVFLPSLGKWVWVDPTYDAYVMNEKGELLDIREVRERIICGQPLLLNPTANWNHRYTPDKKEYLYQYMAKNLYILQCPVESAYDFETATQGKIMRYVQLLPLDYFKQTPDKREFTDPESGVTYVFYNTNNPETFWKHP